MLIGSVAEVLIGSDFADSADCESGGLKASLLQHYQPAQSKIKVNQHKLKYSRGSHKKGQA